MAEYAPSSADAAAFGKVLKDIGLTVPLDDREAALPGALRLRRQARWLREELDRDDR